MNTAFIGGGKMAEAIIAALIRGKVSSPKGITVCDISAPRRRVLATRYGVKTCVGAGDAVSSARVVIVAVKPQQMDEALSGVSGQITGRHLVVSIAAGRKLGYIEKLLPKARVIRVMPNLPCTIGKGVSVFAAGTGATEADKRSVARILSKMGAVLEMPEGKFDAVTAMSGSGPAFFACILGMMASAGVRHGLKAQEALDLALQTMLGTAELLIQTGQAPSELIKAVSSARGTTVAGLSVLSKPATARIIDATIGAAIKRSKELSGS